MAAKRKRGKKKDPRLARARVKGYNKPRRTPNHPKKSHIVVAKVGNKIKTIRFGQQGAKTAGKPKAGESDSCLLYTSPSPRDRQKSRMPSSA